MCLPRLTGDKLMESIRISALGPWRDLARVGGPPCPPAHLPTPGSLLAQFLLVCRSRGHATLDGKTHDSIVQLPASSAARAEQGHSRAGPGTGLDLTDSSITSHHLTSRPSPAVALQVRAMPSQELSWSLSHIPQPRRHLHLVLPLQDTDHFRPDTYGASAVPLRRPGGRSRCQGS